MYKNNNLKLLVLLDVVEKSTNSDVNNISRSFLYTIKTKQIILTFPVVFNNTMCYGSINVFLINGIQFSLQLNIL